MIKYNIKIICGANVSSNSTARSGANLRAVIDPAGSAVVDVLVVWPFTDLFDQPLCSFLKGNSL
jgi:hypothetical protein